VTLVELDAIVLCDALSRVMIAGLSAGERARRVARRVGATRVCSLDRGAPAHELATWRAGRRCPVLVIRADQLVHTPLVAPLIAAARTQGSDGIAIAVGPDGGYAGALLATGQAAGAALAALGRGDSDTAIAAAATARIPHGEIARHSIATADDRRAAHRLLYQILTKPQDNAITRYLYRPVSFPLTRLLVWTPITPNQVSLAVAALVAIGCWLTAHAQRSSVIAGTAVVLVASYLDCCDGEIARVKLLSSRLGAWLDTIVDELSSIGYMAALGWHCHLAFGREFLGELGFDPWIAGSALGVATFSWSVYCIYYNIVVVVGSANSQDYAGRVEVVPGSQPRSVRLRPQVEKPRAPRRELPRWLALLATYAPYLIRRDFISWFALVLAVLGATHVLFALFWLGGAVTCVIVTLDHVRLRRLQRSIRRTGQILESS
jgi:phosphatidylglycerophosphate synthase